MKLNIKKMKWLTATVLIFTFISQFLFLIVPAVYAATTPDLGQAGSFAILANTYTNTVGGTTITGDLGYTTGPATTPTVNGTTHVVNSTYSQAGTDQGAALVALNAQTCDFNFGSPTDLSLLSQPLTPGVYCITAATSIGTGGITLNGSGTYLFRIDGALTTEANSIVTLADGASACDVFWTPTQATTLGANTTFIGTNIDDSGINIGSTVAWTGSALAFGGTVSTDTDTISVPVCDVAETSTESTAISSTATSTSTSTPTAPEAEVCPPLSYVTPIIIESNRVDADSIFVSWGPYSGIDTFNVQYGPSDGDWLYNVNVTGFSTTIDGLPANEPFWVRVAATDNCSIGTYGEAVLVGKPLLINRNTKIPLLPNTGFQPQRRVNQSIASVISTFFSWLFSFLEK